MAVAKMGMYCTIAYLCHFNLLICMEVSKKWMLNIIKKQRKADSRGKLLTTENVIWPFFKL